MTIKTFKPFSALSDCLHGGMFRREDALLPEVLDKVGDDELVHTIDAVGPQDKLRLFRALPARRRVKALLDMSDWSADSVLPSLSAEETWSVVCAAQSDDAADIIQKLDPAARARVIDRLRKDDPQQLLPLMVFEEQTAGGRMKTEMLKFREDMTVESTRKAIAQDPQARGKSHYIYVVDRTDELVGRVSPIKLLQTDAASALKDIADRGVTALPASLDQEQAANAFDENGAIELPVVSHRNKLLGVITADDIFGVLEEEYAEDVSQMSGLRGDARITDPVLLSARRRMPWLGINLITAMLAATVVGLFQDTIERAVILAAFMPVVAGIGGNAAQQGLAVAVRAIAVGEICRARLLRVVAKEVAVGALNGLACGLAVGTLASVWTGNYVIGLVLLMAMTFNLFLGGLVGVGVPLVMRAMRTDPALASTVFVTACTDICGFLVFLGLATVMI